VPVLEGVASVASFGFFGLSESGTLVYYAGRESAGAGIGQVPVWVDRQGNEQPTSVKAGLTGNGIRLSPDGGRISFDMFDPQCATADVWIHDIARATTTRFTFAALNSDALWTPDSKRIIYAMSKGIASRTDSIQSAPSDGSSQPVTILPEASE